MRKSLLTVFAVVAFASGAAPGLTAENTPQQRLADRAPMADDIARYAAQEIFPASYLGNSPSETELPTCTAGSAKDVAFNKNRCR